MTTTLTQITVYWDTQDPANEGWAYRLSDEAGMIDSGGLDSDADDMDGAIDEAIAISGFDIQADSFAREPLVDGGYAVWTADEDYLRAIEEAACDPLTSVDDLPTSEFDLRDE